MDLTDFCPFKSPGEAPGSLFPLPCTSLEHPAILGCRCPGNRRPSILPGAASLKIFPQSKRGMWWPQHCSGELVFSPRERERPGGGCGDPAVPPCRLLGNGSFPELTEKPGRGGKGASPGDVQAPPPEGSVPCVSHSVGFWPWRSPDAGTADEPFPGELEHLQCEGSPHHPPDLQPWLLFQHEPLSPGTIRAAPQQDTPIPDQPLWTHSGFWAWGPGQIPSQDQSTHHLGMWPSHAPGSPAACGQSGGESG